MMERSVSKETENNRYRQILECDTDYCAVKSCLNIISETFDLSLAALAYTERGTKHLQELHDGWNELRGDLQNVAYISLKYNKPVDFEKHVWVDNDGNIMYSKLYEKFGNDEVDKKS